MQRVCCVAPTLRHLADLVSSSWPASAPRSPRARRNKASASFSVNISAALKAGPLEIFSPAGNHGSRQGG
jgi:hypothetical protein